MCSDSCVRSNIHTTYLFCVASNISSASYYLVDCYCNNNDDDGFRRLYGVWRLFAFGLTYNPQAPTLCSPCINTIYIDSTSLLVGFVFCVNNFYQRYRPQNKPLNYYLSNKHLQRLIFIKHRLSTIRKSFLQLILIDLFFWHFHRGKEISI